MAEVLGIVSAGIGIASFAVQIAGTIDAIRKIKSGKVLQDLVLVAERLEHLKLTLGFLSSVQGHPSIDRAVEFCQRRYTRIDAALAKVLKKLPSDSPHPGRKWKQLKLALRYKEDEAISIRDEINAIIIELSMALQLSQLEAPRLQVLTTQTSIVTPQQPVKEENDGPTSASQDRSIELGARKMTHAPVRSARRTDHISPHHQCLSHRISKISGRFFSLEYVPVLPFREASEPAHCECSHLWFNLRLALSRYGIFKALELGIDFVSDAGGFTLRPSLKVQPIVPYTAPGFETILRLKEGLLSFQQATAKLVELHTGDQAFKDHRNPAGISYVHTLVQHGPWVAQEDQFGLMRLFLKEFQVDLAREDQSLLLDCLKWIGEGWHLALLDVILAHGFDPDVANAQLFEQWPSSCSSDWRWEPGTPDPFFLEYVATIVDACPGFAGSTSLHSAILCGSVASVKRLIDKGQPLDHSANMLGQSPLHLAVSHGEKFHLLLNAGYNLDAKDKWGTTPLMYAAALGHKDMATLLITSGANPCLLDRKENRTFLEYAVARDNLELIVVALEAVEATYGQDIGQIFAQHAIVSVILHRGLSPQRARWYGKIIQKCIDVNFTFGDGSDDTEGNSLMRYVQSLDEAKALVSSGFQAFNVPNSNGDLPIHILCEHPDAALIAYCLENGTNVNYRGQDSHTTIGRLLLSLRSASWRIWDVMDSVQICLRMGADVFFADDCQCPCSPDGCGAAAIFQLDLKVASILSRAPDVIWAFEWLLLVEEHRGTDAAKQVMLSYLHRLKCDDNDLSITHVCCHRGNGKGGTMFHGLLEPKSLVADAVEEILEEEEDFIQFLEQDIESLAAESLESLKSRWVSLLQERYFSHLKGIENKKPAVKNKLRTGNSTGYFFEVDYAKDEYRFGYCSGSDVTFSSFPRVAASLAEYATWLEHERTRHDTSEFYRLHKEGWYERRLASLLSLMDAFDITDDKIAKKMEESTMTETRTETIKPKAASASFMASIQSLRDTIAT